MSQNLPLQGSYTNVPLNDDRGYAQPSRTSSPLPSGASTPNGSAGRHKKPWNFLQPSTTSPEASEMGISEKKRPKYRSAGSWDLLGDKADWEEYNVAQASVENLRFAEGDVGTNKVR